VNNTSSSSTPARALWTLTDGPHRLQAKLQKSERWGWELNVFHNGIFRYSERHPTSACAIAEADACRSVLLDKGWTVASRFQ